MNLSTTIKMEEAIDFHYPKARSRLDDMYEQVLGNLRRAGNAGEFCTPRAVTEFMVAHVDPRLGSKESGRETVLDSACGTSGFPNATIDHFEKQLDTHSGPDDRRVIADCIRGMEKKQLPHLTLHHQSDAPRYRDAEHDRAPQHPGPRLERLAQGRAGRLCHHLSAV
jgi:type I restriction enzyme M protein